MPADPTPISGSAEQMATLLLDNLADEMNVQSLAKRDSGSARSAYDRNPLSSIPRNMTSSIHNRQRYLPYSSRDRTRKIQRSSYHNNLPTPQHHHTNLYSIEQQQIISVKHSDLNCSNICPCNAQGHRCEAPSSCGKIEVCWKIVSIHAQKYPRIIY